MYFRKKKEKKKRVNIKITEKEKCNEARKSLSG